MQTEALTVIDTMEPIKVKNYLKVTQNGLDLAKQIKQKVKVGLKNQDQCDFLNVGIGKVKKARKFIEICRKAKKAKYIEAGKKVDAQAKEIDEPFAGAEGIAVAEVRKWDDAQQAKFEAAEAKVEKETTRRKKISDSKNGDGSAIQPVAAPISPTLIQSTTYRNQVSVEIVEAKKVADVYYKHPKVIEALNFAVTESVKAYVRERGGAKNVPEEQLPVIQGCNVKYEKVRVN